jgi:uncharacterized sporulation protein YeaH/YhbH (DUF444 family)
MFGINRDVERFNQIVRGKVKQDLRKYMSKQEIIANKGGKTVSIPLPRISLPRFKYASDSGGIGQGNGNQPGNEPHDNILEVDVSLEEMADLLGEELELPRIEPKGKKDLTIDSNRYRGLRRIGPESLRSFKHTFKEALKRSIGSGTYDPDNPLIIPIKDDRRYKSPEPVFLPRSQAAIIYMMDVSGSMNERHKLLARLTSFWIDTWLRRNFKCIESRYVIHNEKAWEVTEEAFYRIREGGGTKISSAYQEAKKIIQESYSPSEWNIYLFQYSDGDDWGDGSSGLACSIIKELVPHVNQIAYCQVQKSGNFLKHISKFKDTPEVVWTAIESREEVYDAIKLFFQKGR